MNKIKVGFFSFTEITDPNEHRSYNEWHMLDHMPEQYPLAGLAFGERWVRTPACAQAAVVSDAPFDAVHYVTLYLMTDPIDRTLREFMDLGAQLHALGRFHEHRRSHFGGPLRLLESDASPRVLISGDAVPYRPNRGVYVVVEEPVARAGIDEYAHWLHREHHPALLGVDGVAGLWTFTTTQAFKEQYGTGDRRVTVMWLDDEPVATAARVDAADAARRARGDTHVQFAGPFEAIVPWQWAWFD